MNQPIRRKVLEALLKSKEPLYIKEIAEIIEATERNTSFHLSRLAKEGFVEGEFKPINSSTGRAGKYYQISSEVKPKVKKIIELKI